MLEAALAFKIDWVIDGAIWIGRLDSRSVGALALRLRDVSNCHALSHG